MTPPPTQPEQGPSGGPFAVSGHEYISTACYHHLHERCRRNCKFCDAPCNCECHTLSPEPPISGELYRITPTGNIGIGTPVPKHWLDFRGIGHISKPNRWQRFWAWALLGWHWERPR